ncbi:hypothetical protein BH11MYX2_BH11MYX2_35100 [soil metagenome]
MSDDNELEAAVAMYREQLRAEADLGNKDLAEIEDHLRDLIAELCDSGMPLAEATREAATRLGDPRALAREHSRVRTPFGSKLPTWRAGLAVAALLAQLVLFVRAQAFVPPLQMMFEVGLGTLLIAGLVARLTWPRPILLATVVLQFAWAVFAREPMVTLPWEVVVFSGVTIAMLVPWRRGELRAPSWALGLLYVSYLGASWMAHAMTPWGELLAPAAGFASMLLVVTAAAGVVLRARWAGFAALVASTLLVVGFAQILRTPWEASLGFEQERYLAGALVNAGAVGAAIAAVVAWRTARSTEGTFRDVLA